MNDCSVGFKNKTEYYLLAIIFLFGVFFRLKNLMSQNLWIDEIGQFMVARLNLISLVQAVKFHAAALPLDYILMHFTTAFSEGEFFVRLNAFMFSCLSVLISYYFMRRLFPKERYAALMAMVFMVSAVMQVKYATEARFYALFVLITLLHWWSFARAVNTHKITHWIVYSLITFVGCATHFYSVFNIFMQSGYLVYFSYRLYSNNDKKKIKSIIVSFITALMTSGVVIIFLWYYYWPKSSFQSSSPLTITYVTEIIRSLMGGSITFGLICFLGSVIKKEYRLSSLLLIIGIFISGISVLILNHYKGYFIHYRQLLFLQPLIFCIMALGLSNWMNISIQIIDDLKTRKRIGSIISIILMMVFLFKGFWIDLSNEKNFIRTINPEWKKTVAYIQDHSKETPLIICLDEPTRHCIDYYSKISGFSIPIVATENVAKIETYLNQGLFKEIWYVEGGIVGKHFNNLNEIEATKLTSYFDIATQKKFKKLSVVKMKQKEIVGNNKMKEVGIDFGKYIVRSMLLENWSSDENIDQNTDVVWSLNKHASLILPMMFDKDAEMIFKFNSPRKQQVKITLNNHEIVAENIEPGWQEIKSIIKKNYWNSSNNIMLIQNEKYIVSFDDLREMALLCDYIKIKEIP